MDTAVVFGKLRENADLRKTLSAFSGAIRATCWALLSRDAEECPAMKNNEPASCKALKTRKSCIRHNSSKIYKCLRRSARSKSPEEFICGEVNAGVCVPVFNEEEVAGYMVFCGMKKSLRKEQLHLLSVISEMAVDQVRGEIELEEINKTVRPRAIALSTVHTVHRLMTSTLNLNDLLPMIARLSLQIIRANRCSIKLVDKKRKLLLPKATIDLRKKTTRLKKVQIGKYAPGRAVKKGAPVMGSNYLAVPMVDEDVVGVITLYDKLDGKGFSNYDQEIMKTLSEQAAIAIKNAQLYKQQTDLTLSSIKCIAQLLQNRPYMPKRAEASFMKLIYIIGRKFKMNAIEINMLQYAAMLHDAGQISIPEKLLMKRGNLTEKEFNILKMHPLKGASLFSKFRPLKPIIPIILYHHENYDGTGYPKGLKGGDIPLAARILSVVGTFEAMLTQKPYRRALSIPVAVREIRKNSGRQFDPEVVKIFHSAVQRKDVIKLLEKELERL
ncbi:MAG: GAF domain-containing protein [Candidatus Omnitrophica bacterium]|nr:GAF domain-containing protein [Candidatus Omnitrophota bacterium]MDD5488817.1 GAF domain-containing protein [Candidatus Omnitrophota bacterium]